MINFQPIPILFQIGPLHAYSFGVMIALAALVMLFLVLKRAKKEKIDEKHIYNLTLFIFIFGFF